MSIHLKPLLLNSLLLVLISVFINACARINVQGSIIGNQQGRNITATNLTFTRRSAQAINFPRIYINPGRAEAENLLNPLAKLNITSTGSPGNLNERYHFIAYAKSEWDYFGGTSAERDYVINHSNKVVHISGTIGSDQQLQQLTGTRHIGTSYIAIIQANDRIIPWRIDRNATNCVAMGNNDCLDMETITKSLFTSISNQVRSSISSPASVFNDGLRFIVQTIHKPLETAPANPQRCRGFGFIYFASIQFPGGSFDIEVPVSFLFLNDINDYRLLIDPFSFQSRRLSLPENLNRLYVRGTLVVNLLEGMIRDTLKSIFSRIVLPADSSGVPYESFLYAGFTTVAGNTPLFGSPPTTYPSYEVILLPEQEGVNLSTTIWRRERDTNVIEGQPIRLIFLE